MNLKISVTKKDIIRGRRRSPFRCPVALAFKRALLSKKKRSRPGVGSQTFLVNIKGHYYQGVLPAKAIHFIDRFDSKKSVKPFRFTLSIL